MTARAQACTQAEGACVPLKPVQGGEASGGETLCWVGRSTEMPWASSTMELRAPAAHTALTYASRAAGLSHTLSPVWRLKSMASCSRGHGVPPTRLLPHRRREHLSVMAWVLALLTKSSLLPRQPRQLELELGGVSIIELRLVNDFHPNTLWDPFQHEAVHALNDPAPLMPEAAVKLTDKIHNPRDPDLQRLCVRAKKRAELLHTLVYTALAFSSSSTRSSGFIIAGLERAVVAQARGEAETIEQVASDIAQARVN
eukprot:CAMPEP_0181206904 /NCGR_PEP_ID=MMETSP1096-20121128/21286_1 /TAXON_ID=156174 ORGANISM="Chrysochromulina ericina, Strain CCMP281" /NCGR_SAMPLE_ID=MMETSP1096 /ASSEMBLY_ACC=CAM_ASM_000453 /LENGTH=255 /DNA_ID=CAMNT_0023297839 /DNA_START=235 /DNA_END=1003 /DNA_ORIENTATION=+